MSTSLEEVVAYIRAILQEHNEGVRGADLMSSIRRQYPEFQPVHYGATNLRSFVAAHLPDVGPTGRSGMDYVYALVKLNETEEGGARREKESAGIGEGSYGASIWKTFASPSSEFALYGHRESGTLVACSIGVTPPGASWVRVPPLPSEAHAAIAIEFIENLVEDRHKQALRAYLERPQWWFSFYEAVKALGMGPAWNALRRTRIMSHLVKSLDELGIPSAGAEAQIREQQREEQKRATAKTPPMSSDSEKILGPAAVGTQGKPARMDIRLIAERLVGRMSLSELRSLRVTLGDVFDVLDK